MPSQTGYNPPSWFDRRSLEDMRDVDNPGELTTKGPGGFRRGAIFSGMTKGLAVEDGDHVVVTDMPGETRNIGRLPVFDPWDVPDPED